MQERIEKLNELFPKINATCSSEWDGNEGGIWFRQEGECHSDGEPYFGYSEPHPAVAAVLEEMGLFAEPYDGGTWFAWQ